MKPVFKYTAAALLALTALGAQAEGFSDTYIGYRYGTQFREPSNPNDISKNIIQFTHASSYAYGSNFLNIDGLLSDDKDPSNGSSSKGATEIYLTYRTQLSLGKTTSMKTAFGPVRDLAVTAGFDLNTKNTGFAPGKRLLVVGPTVKFDVPGFLDLSLLYSRESNHCGLSFCTNHDVTFDPALMLSAAWGIPFQVGSAPMKFQGFVNYIGKKGRDYSGNDTAAETLLRTSVMVDVGQMAFNKKNAVWVGVGYEYWKNKFGNAPGVGTRASTPMLQAEIHF